MLKKGKSFYVLRTSGKWSQMANGYWVKTSLTKKTSVYPTITPSSKANYKAKLKKKASRPRRPHLMQNTRPRLPAPTLHEDAPATEACHHASCER